ncbi:hypothetical protein HNY73_004875 [Argiope bruennichi]|uniref:Uncharacterized protein n=1 Tax=Argiope bruennichi TaxID=94029 RepID=A0A8T0FRZ4_ARGBR|nr:hypothetical protein HNY73_004875 [Argiope bruennichi]
MYDISLRLNQKGETSTALGLRQTPVNLNKMIQSVISSDIAWILESFFSKYSPQDPKESNLTRFTC